MQTEPVFLTRGIEFALVVGVLAAARYALGRALDWHEASILIGLVLAPGTVLLRSQVSPR